MEPEEVEIAEAAHRAAEERLAGWADVAGVAVRRGPGWVAVRTGADSNDLNGVVSQAGVRIGPGTVHDLLEWFGAAPASWLARLPSARLTGTLLGAGARPERTGRWSGRRVPLPVPDARPDVEVVRVTTPADLDTWLDLAASCDWLGDAQDRRVRRALYLAEGGRGALTHWVARVEGEPVGFASSSTHGPVLDLCNLGVHPSRRRQGIGRALVAARVTASPGASLVVSAPSPDGWRLQQSLGFTSVPVLPDRCLYLPTR